MCAFGPGRVAASIDTPLHAFLPAPHVDHLHPDWAIALAASANGRARLDEFNARYGRHIVWVPWQRPGIRAGVDAPARGGGDVPAATASCSAAMGLFTWGKHATRVLPEQRRRRSIRWGSSSRTTRGSGAASRSVVSRSACPRHSIARRSRPPCCRCFAARCRRIAGRSRIGTAPTRRERSPSRDWAEDLCRLGTSCPDHFLRTRICPMFVPWSPARRASTSLHALIEERVGRYRSGLRRVLPGVRDAFIAGAARQQPVGRRHSRARHVSGSPRTSARRESPRSSTGTRST